MQDETRFAFPRGAESSPSDMGGSAMVDKSKPNGAEEPALILDTHSSRGRAVQRALGWLGVIVAAPFFIWVPLALVSPVPSMIDVFGVVGLRIPASITIGALLLAAIGFHEV